MENTKRKLALLNNSLTQKRFVLYFNLFINIFSLLGYTYIYTLREESQFSLLGPPLTSIYIQKLTIDQLISAVHI